MFKLFNTSSGKKSHTTTIMWISFIWVLGALTLGLVDELSIGDLILKFRMLDSSIVLCLLGPSFGLYAARRGMENKIGKEQ